MEQNQGIKSWQWVVTVIVIIILIVLGYYMFKGGEAVPASTDVTTEIPMVDANESNRIVVMDQYPGNVVYVSSVQLANAGWVAIHKDNNGTVGTLVGSMYFSSGINPGKITLTEKTVDGGTYYAMLHSDDGDKKFDATKDVAIKDSKGNSIMKVFKATSNVTEVKG
jgi:hypothetical protein